VEIHIVFNPKSTDVGLTKLAMNVMVDVVVFFCLVAFLLDGAVVGNQRAPLVEESFTAEGVSKEGRKKEREQEEKQEGRKRGERGERRKGEREGE
jgi:hypothetical protein